MDELKWTILVHPYQTLWKYSIADPLTGASNTGGVGKNQDSYEYLAIGSMTAGVRSTGVTINCAVVYSSSH